MGLLKLYTKTSLVFKLIIALILGAICGVVFGEKMAVIEQLGKLFLNLLKMSVLPLIIVNLIRGVASLRDIKSFGRIGGKIALYYSFTTALAIIIGTEAAILLKPGVGFELLSTSVTQMTTKMPSIGETLVGLFPSNIFKAMANGRLDQVVVFCTLLGLAVMLLKADDREKMIRAFSMLSDLFTKLIMLIMQFVAPIGIFALFSCLVGKYGSTILGPLSKFTLGMYISILLMYVVYVGFVYIFTKTGPVDFLKKALPLMATAIGTNSSNASIPMNLQCADSLGVSKKISAFTIPLGAQMNKDGNGILLSMMFVFASQIMGLPLTVTMFTKMMFLALILTTGAGGIAGGGIVCMTI